MSYEKRDNSGTLGKNKNPLNEKSPPYTGAASIDGAGYWISGWVKENNDTGEKFFSLSFKKKQKLSVEGPSTPQPTQQFDDDIPFAFLLPSLVGLACGALQFGSVIA